MSWLGTAVIAAIAIPAAHVLASQPGQSPELVEAFVLFAPGMAGIAVISNLSRVMFAIGRLKVAAAALAGSWLLVIEADVVLAELAPPAWWWPRSHWEAPSARRSSPSRW